MKGVDVERPITHAAIIRKTVRSLVSPKRKIRPHITAPKLPPAPTMPDTAPVASGQTNGTIPEKHPANTQLPVGELSVKN